MLSFLTKGLPAHFWLIIIYGVTIAVYSGADIAGGFLGDEGAVETEALSLGAQLENSFNQAYFNLPLFGTSVLPISVTTIFMALGFVAQWIEAIRATQIRKTGGNDLISVLIAFGAVLLFVGVPAFQTTAFLVIVIVGFGDIILDRIIGQAVARRDFGGVGITGGE